MSCCHGKKFEEEEQSSCCSAGKHSHHHHHDEEEEAGGCCAAPKKAKTQKQAPVRIERTMTIEEVLSYFPHKAQRLAQEITQAGLHCIGCGAAVWETLEGGMVGHGKTDAEIDELVRRLNALLDEEVDLTTISMTSRAASKYLSILAEEGKQGWGLRFGVRPAGCSGFEYALDYSEKASPEDETFVSHGIEIHVEKELVPQLCGSELDYVDNLHGTGFKISNPNVKSSCGCGNSHNY